MPTLIADGREFEISSEVWLEWKARADPFETPNDVLERILGSHTDSPEPTADIDTQALTNPRFNDGPAGKTPAPRQKKTRRRRTRAASNSLLAETEYELPILSTLANHDGRLPTREVIDEVGEILADKLTPVDREPLRAGGPPRWHNRAQFARLRLVESGFMKSDSPRGVWEISPEGRARLSEGDVK